MLATFLFRQNVFGVCFAQGLLEHFNDRAIKDIISEASRVVERMSFSIPSINYPTQDFGDERLLTPQQWKDMLSEFDVKARYYKLDLQSVNNSLLRRKIPKPWHILIEIPSSLSDKR